MSEFLILHSPQKDVDGAHIANLPHSVGHAVFIRDFDLGGRLAGKEDLFRGQRGVRIEHENLSEVGSGGAQQVQAVGLGLGKRLFVTEDHLLAVIAYLTQGDKGAALVHLSVACGTVNRCGITKMQASFS